MAKIDNILLKIRLDRYLSLNRVLQNLEKYVAILIHKAFAVDCERDAV